MTSSSLHSAPSPGTPDAAAPLPAIEVDVFCPSCGYNLRGLTGARCPECGTNIEAYRERASVIPWVYRDKIGRIRAFWKTVWLVTFNGRRFGIEITRPVDEGAARRFRWAVVAHAYPPMLTISVLVFVWGFLPTEADAIIAASVMQVLFVACLAVVTILPFWGFRHRSLSPEMQHRAAVLMLYASAPLALLPLAGVLVIIGRIAQVNWRGDVDLICYLSSGGVAVVSLAMMAEVIRRSVRNALGKNLAAIWLGAKLVLACLAMAFFIVAVLPASLLFLGLVYYSLF